MRPLIVAFCRTNLALLEEVRRLHDDALAAERDADGRLSVRVIRCLTKCHTCGEIPYVRVGESILTSPDTATFRSALAARSDDRPEPGA